MPLQISESIFVALSSSSSCCKHGCLGASWLPFMFPQLRRIIGLCLGSSTCSTYWKLSTGNNLRANIGLKVFPFSQGSVFHIAWRMKSLFSYLLARRSVVRSVLSLMRNFHSERLILTISFCLTVIHIFLGFSRFPFWFEITKL